MRVLLISTNRERRPSFAIPTGVAYLQTALVHANHEAQILDLCFEDDDHLSVRVREKLQAFPADLIGISIRNVDNETYLRYRGNLGDVKIVVETCRTRSNAPIVLGGSAFSLMPEEIMRILGVEYGVIGEGEEAIVRIADALQEGFPIENVPGLVVLRGDYYATAQPARVQQIEQITAPKFFFPDPRYFSTQVVGPQPTYGVQTKRGCSFRCTYCPVPSIEGKRFRLRRPEDLVAEMQRVKEVGKVERFFITDSIFNIPRRHAMAVCKAMIEGQLNIKWMAYANPLQFDQELADLFVEAGCEILNFGLDAACPEMLAALKKDFTVEDIINATHCCKQTGMRVIHSLLLGGPHETVETVKKTLTVMSRVAPHILTIAFGIRLYPQTTLWQELVPAVTDPVNMLEPLFYVSPHLTPSDCKEVLAVIEQFIADHPRMMVKMNFDPQQLAAESSSGFIRTSSMEGAAIV